MERDFYDDVALVDKIKNKIFSLGIKDVVCLIMKDYSLKVNYPIFIRQCIKQGYNPLKTFSIYRLYGEFIINPLYYYFQEQEKLE